MRLFFTTAACALAIPAIAAAQYSGSSSSSAKTPPPAEASATAPAQGAAGSAVTSGMTVKDKTGASIGQVTEVKADASGKQMATIKMGADTFAVDTSALAVDKGSAVINATQSEIKNMLPKKQPE